ncbi:MAG: Cna B-type domain-containing protein [Candidatus Faecivicinus sp.]
MKYSLRRLAALLVAALMLLSAFSGALADTEYSNTLEIDMLQSSSGSTVDHIDIACTGLNANVYVNDEWRNVTFSFTKQEVDNGTVDVDITSSASFSIKGTSTSTGSTTGAQVRFEGSFPVGTKDSPVNYTVTFRKTLTVDGVSIPVVLSASYNYWTSANDCPGLKGKETQWKNGAVISGSGIDLTLGQGSGEYGTVNITKKVTGLELTDDNAVFHFCLVNKGDGSEIYVDCPVSKETGEGSVTVTLVPYGTYMLYEVDYVIPGYWCDVLLKGNQENVLDSQKPVINASFLNEYVSKYVSVKVSKEWNDNGNEDGVRPDSVTVELLANGEPTGNTLTLSAENNWEGSFTDLSRRPNNDYVKPDIVYTIREVDVPEGYESNITGSAAEGFVVTNTQKNSIIISGSKTWVDDDNRDNARPEKIIINLLANGDKVDEKIVTAEDGWKWSFEAAKYDADGKKINYTITEEDVEGYKSVVDGFNVTNTHEIETIEKITVSKEWNDADNQDGKRPDSVTVELLADGNSTGKSLTLSANNNWSASFTRLPVYEKGQKIVYSIVEWDVPDYEANVTGSVENGFVVTNTHEPEKIEIEGSKTWDDNGNQDGKRPKEITIRLYADGNEIAQKTVTEQDGWKWSFTGLDKYAGGEEIVYTITEDDVKVDGYTSLVTGYNVKNSYTPGKVNVSVLKAWDDNNNQDGKRPAEVVVKLYADGADTGRTVALNSGNNWQASFTDLEEYKAGEKIVYTVAEAQVADGYTANVEQKDESTFIITNSHTPEKIDVISGSKTWDDNDNAEDKRPESITIRLYANGIETRSAVVTEEAGWEWNFTDLDKYAGGKEIVYTIREDDVEGYTAKVDGFNVTNTLIPDKIDEISGSKTWKDDDNSGKTRPESITIRLYANGDEVAQKTVTAEDGWKWSFTDLDRYADGEEIVYTIKEDSVKGYTAEVDGFNVTNTLNDVDDDDDDDEVPKTGSERSNLQRTMLYLGMAFLMLGVVCMAASARKRQNKR